MNLLDVDKEEQKRRTYFHGRGYVEPPYEQDERYKLALDLSSRDPEAACVLYDPLQDCKHTPFLQLLSSILGNPRTRLYNPTQSETFARKAYLYADRSQQTDAAQNYLAAHLRTQGCAPAVLINAPNDQVLTDATTTLLKQGIKPDVFRFDASADFADFASAVFQGAGAHMRRNDQEVIAAYEAHIQGQLKGFLTLSYQNLALRMTLGLGCEPNPEKAQKLLETAEFLLNGGEDVFKDLREVLKGFIRKRTQAYYFRISYDACRQYAQNENQWLFMDDVREAGERKGTTQDREALLDVLNLYAMLAHAENWPDIQDWERLLYYARKEFAPIKGLHTNIRTINDLTRIEEFYTGVEQEPSRLILTPNRYKMFAHFCKHKLGVPPFLSNERFKLSYEFTQKIPPQYEHAYILFDEKSDADDKDWLARAAFILDAHLNNNKTFNPKKAEKLYIRAAELGSPMAAFNLAVKYQSGLETEINLDKALTWYKRADELGEAHAKNRIASVLKSKNEMDNPESDCFYTDEIVQLYREGYFQGDLVAANSYAKLYIISSQKEPDVGLKIYDWILTQIPSYSEEYTHAETAYIMSIRSYIGLDITRDIHKASEYLTKIPDQSNHSNVRFYLQELKKRLKRFVANDTSADNKDLAFIQRLYNEPGEIHRAIQQLNQPNAKVSDRLVNYVVCMQWLANAEEWPLRYDWDDLREATQALQLGVHYSDVLKSTNHSGPRYTPFDRRGLPVLGVWSPPSKDQDEEIREYQRTGSYVPMAGTMGITGVEADASGFHYQVQYSQNLPAMLLSEDFLVAETLMFGSPEGPIWPSLGLELDNLDTKNKTLKEKSHTAFSYKNWTPEWLGHTDFGRTLFVTDNMLGLWSGLSHRFTVGGTEDVFEESVDKLAHAFIRDLRLTGGRDGGAESALVMLQPKHFARMPSQKNGIYRVDNMHLTMKIYGAYTNVKDGKEDRGVHAEDPNFSNGRTVKKLTDYYNTICRLDPRYERARQLMNLLYGLAELRRMGYTPPISAQKQLQHNLAHFEKLGRIKANDVLVRRAFSSRPENKASRLVI